MATGEPFGSRDQAQGDAGAEAPHGITRRVFVAGAGAVAGGVLLDNSWLGLAGARPRFQAEPAAALNGLVDYVPLPGSVATLLLNRREDLVRIQLDLFNLKFNGQNLAIKTHGKPSYLVYTFGPQHVVEEALLETSSAATNAVTTGEAPGVGGIDARLAGPSRLAFLVAADNLPVLTLDSLLNFTWLASVAPVAASNPGAGSAFAEFVPPGVTQTAIEMPWHLVLTPDSGPLYFGTPDGLQLTAGRAALWTARMQQHLGGNFNTANEGGPIRAPWTLDLQDLGFAGTQVGPGTVQPSPPLPGQADDNDREFPWTQGLSMFDRWNIAHATNDPTLASSRQAVNAKRLWLSARGGHLDVEGDWNLPSWSQASDLKQWQQRTIAGRDHHIKVVDNGYLFPFGHRATVTIVSDRQFQRLTNGSGQTIARLRQYAYITVLQKTVEFPNRDFPFTSLTLITERTPLIVAHAITNSSNHTPPTGQSNPPQSSYTDGWVPYVDGAPFLFHYVGVDWAGRKVSFTASALFVLKSAAVNASKARTYIDAYNKLDAGDPIRSSDLGEQKVAFAPPKDPSNPGDTDAAVQTLSFAGKYSSGGGGPAVLPTMSSLAALGQPGNDPAAIVRLPVAEQMSGGALGGNGTPSFVYNQLYAANGFGGPNLGSVFLQNSPSAAQGLLSFAGGSSGGLLTPNLSIDGLSRELGPVSDAANLAAGNFDPSAVFKDITGASFLGGISLSDILGNFTIPSGGLSTGSPGPVPAITLLPFDPANPTKVKTQVSWAPTIDTGQQWLTPAPGSSTISISLLATITTDVANHGSSTVDINGSLDNFVFTLLGPGPDSDVSFIELTFSSLAVTAGTGKKTHVTPHLTNVGFINELSFIQELEDLLSFTGDGGGVKVYIDGTGVHADVTVSLPPVGLGLFTLSGISFFAGLDLPLDGVSPAVFTFGFASAHDPFTIAGGIFGGGGYFLIGIGTKDVQQIQVSFNFGAVLALDLGVASGSVSLVAGFTYSYVTSPKEKCDIQAWLKFHGNLQILGIITLSLEFDLVLDWDTTAGDLTGTATLIVGVSLCGLSKSVTLTATKTFSSSGGIQGEALLKTLAKGPQGPGYGDEMLSSDWTLYCEAFG